MSLFSPPPALPPPTLGLLKVSSNRHFVLLAEWPVGFSVIVQRASRRLCIALFIDWLMDLCWGQCLFCHWHSTPSWCHTMTVATSDTDTTDINVYNFGCLPSALLQEHYRLVLCLLSLFLFTYTGQHLFVSLVHLPLNLQYCKRWSFF